MVNVAGFRNAPVAPGSLAAAFGDFSGVTASDAAAIPLPKQMNGVQVLVNDVAAPLIAVRAGQINFQVPAATAAGSASVRVQRNGSDLAVGTVSVASVGAGTLRRRPAESCHTGCGAESGLTPGDGCLPGSPRLGDSDLRQRTGRHRSAAGRWCGARRAASGAIETRAAGLLRGRVGGGIVQRPATRFPRALADQRARAGYARYCPGKRPSLWRSVRTQAMR